MTAAPAAMRRYVSPPREAFLHALQMVIVAAYDRPVDPDSDTSDIPDTELAARAHTRTEHVLRRAFSA